ncbi:long-chain fatty acid--CoA ligase [Halobacteriales archaeon QS_6_71_20]|nr:MAG: long-chain fatty acid--CoA ligase [Halobacteriales archaeon QS_6_71_20]
MEKPLLATEFLDRARRNYGDREAVVGVDGDRYTYDELGERADGFAAGLQERGVGKGDRVAVLDPNTHRHLEAAYGCFQTGAVHTPLNYRLVESDFEYILNDAGVTAVYADHAYAETVQAVRDDVPTETFVTDDPDAVEGDWEAFEDVVGGGTDYDRPEMSEDEVVTINYTSGTTGDPKGVCRTHRTETLHAYIISVHQEISDDDTYLWTLPMFHVNGWGHIYAVTGMGARHVCTRGVDAEYVFEMLRTEDVTYFCAAPTVIKMLGDHLAEHGGEPDAGQDVRVATAGAAPPEATIRTAEDEFGWYMKHVYGATETGPLITTSDARRYFDDDSDDRFAVKKSQGFGYLGTEIRVVDEDGNDVPADGETIGEIVVRGNQVMDRYWDEPDATAEAFSDRVDGYYHMGDLAVVNDDGMIQIQDRKKDIIVSGGENISSIEVEDTLFSHDRVDDVAVVPSPHDDWGETPKAFVVPAGGDPNDPGVTADDLIRYARDDMAHFKAPTRIEFVKQLPKTSTGKVQKFELRQAEWDGEERMVGQG